MKSKLLLLSFLMLLTIAKTYAQASFTNAGIAVQGIARDANNTALQNLTVSLEFEFYYFDASSTLKPIGSVIGKQVLTDNFGVFSTIIDPNFANNQLFSNYKVWLRIKKNGDTSYMSEAPLNHVPYAISANNGVPTGSIMPYMGKVAPAGWLLCDGNTTVPEGSLKTLLTDAGVADPSKTPNLKGMFLRGAGGNSLTSMVTVLGQPYDDAIEKHDLTVIESAHNHGVNDPGHDHPIIQGKNTLTAGTYSPYGVIGPNNGYFSNPTEKNTTGITVSGNKTNIIVKYAGDVETRPVNYGVNYIIKI